MSDSSNEPKLVIPPAKAPVEPPVAIAPVEDVSTQALSEALQSSFHIVRLLMVILVVLFFGSGMFTVEPNEVAVRLRFGKPMGTGADQLLKPGWHWAFPKPIDEVVKIPVGRSHSVTSTVGWYYNPPDMEAKGIEPQGRGSLMPGVDGYILTGDGNIIHVKATLTYRISDPLSYAFNFMTASNVLQNVLDNAIIYAGSQFTADGAIYKDHSGYQELVMNRVNKEIDRLKLGVTVEPREVLAKAPLDVRPAFDEVLNAQQTARTKVSEAEAYAVGQTNRAAADATVIFNEGLSSSNRLVQTVAAEAQSFSDQLPYYMANPALFRQRLVSETMARIMTNAQDKFFVPQRADARPRELRLLLNPEPPKATRFGQP